MTSRLVYAAPLLLLLLAGCSVSVGDSSPTTVKAPVSSGTSAPSNESLQIASAIKQYQVAYSAARSHARICGPGASSSSPCYERVVIEPAQHAADAMSQTLAGLEPRVDAGCRQALSHYIQAVEHAPFGGVASPPATSVLHACR